MSEQDQPIPSSAPPEMSSSGLSGVRLHTLLAEVHERLAGIVNTRDRLQAVLDAVLTVGAGLELQSTLQRVVRAAVELVNARYGALGVLGEDGLAEFLYEGIDPRTRSRMGKLPDGRGLLATVTAHEHSIRLPDIGEHPDSIGFPPHHPPMSTFLGTPIHVRDEVFGGIYVTDKDGGGEFTPDDEAALDALAAAAGMAVENARRFEQSRAREQWLATSAEINEELLHGASTEDLLNVIVERARDLSGADRVFILLPAETPGGGLVVRAAAGEGAPDLLGVRLAVEEGMVAKLFAESNVRRIADLGTLIERSMCPAVEICGPGVAVRLRTADGISGGLLAVRGKGAPQFPADHEAMLTSFAHQAAMALEFAEQQENIRQLDVLADRTRIAADLHDHVIQRLFATGISLQGTVRRITDPDARHRVTRAVDELDATVRQIRAAIFDLSTTAEDRATSLRRRLLDVVAEVGAKAPITPVVRTFGPVDTIVPDQVGDHAVVVLRSALASAFQHVRASEITVTIEAGRELTIEVVDNGAAVPSEAAHVGLLDIERRAAQCGGTVVVTTAGTGGTRLTWCVPLRRRP
jgi:GAF domain-containing protein